MTFEEWINRPVYKVQVHTAKLLGIHGNIYTTGEHPFFYLRLRPAYRCAKSLALRKGLADKVRETRKNGTYKLERVTA